MVRNLNISNFPKVEVGYPMHFVYALSDPITNEICYVGETSDPERRLKEHCRNVGNLKGNAWVTTWMLSLLDEPGSPAPIMEILCQFEDPYFHNARLIESEFINALWKAGHPLLNRTRSFTSRKNIGTWDKRYYESEWRKRKGIARR